jgi:hypothetical protein
LLNNGREKNLFNPLWREELVVLKVGLGCVRQK